MATAFTTEEREKIQERLIEVALRYASGLGSRHVTVDELAHQAGISKGAFYSFFESKERLFLAMVERIHQEMYGNAARVLEQNSALPLRERVTRAIYEVFRVARERNVVSFIREETPLLLRRLPGDVAGELYHSDEEHIRDLIKEAKVELATSLETASAVVRILLMTLPMKGDVGSHYDDAMRLMIAGACDQVLKG